MTGSTLTALAANPAPNPETSLISIRPLDAQCSLLPNVLWMLDTTSLVEKHPIMHFAKHTKYANEQNASICSLSMRNLHAKAFVPLRFANFFTQKYFPLKPLPRRHVPSF